MSQPHTPPPAIRPFSESLPMGLLRAREASMRLFRPVLKTHELTEQQWRVLRCLSASEASLSVGEVAERTFLLGPSLSRIVARLDERGLIERTTPAGDQRQTLLALTAGGRKLVARVAPHSEATYNDIEDAFGARRLQTLMDELHALASLVGDIDEDVG